MRACLLTVTGAAVLVLAGCGDGGDTPPAPEPRARLKITSPADTAIVRRATIDVRGTVSPPSATVRVLGRPALVSGGTFTVVVPLEPGANVIDAAASARGYRSAVTALRVTREQRVVVPDLAGVDEDELEGRLAPLGLKVAVQERNDFFDQFIPRAPSVCEQEPAAGTRVRRGTTVTVVVGRSC